MISVSEAKNSIQENVERHSSVNLSLELASGLILAKDIYASINIPAFPQSGMDGYAIAFASIPVCESDSGPPSKLLK